MVWPRDVKLKRLQHEASQHNKEVVKEILNSPEYSERHDRKLKYTTTPEEDYLTGFGSLIE